MKLFIKYIFLLSIVVAFTCCQVRKVSKLQKATEATYIEIQNSHGKNVRFVGMVHVAKPEFYSSVKQIVEKSKMEGYVLYLEGVKDINTSDTINRKFRRILGTTLSTLMTDYDKMSENSDGMVPQSKDMFLNIVNSQDCNIDVSVTDMVQAYEQEFHTIELTERDWNTPLDQALDEVLPYKNTQRIIEDYRNKFLANAVDTTANQKIIILYGVLHRKGFITELKELDSSWKKVKGAK